MNYGYGPQEMDTAQNLVVRAGRRADPPIHDAYDHFIIPRLGQTALNKCVKIKRSRLYFYFNYLICRPHVFSLSKFEINS